MTPRPIGVTIVSILFFVIGILFFLVGLQAMFTLSPTTIATINLILGAAFVLFGGMLFAVGWGMYAAKNWARLIGIVLSVIGSISGLAIGVLLIAGVWSSLVRGEGYIVLGLLAALVGYFLLRPEVDAFFSEAGLIYSVEPTMAAPPTPVVTAPPSVSNSAHQRGMPETEVIGAPQSATAWLVARNGARAGKEYGLQRGRNTIGRDGSQCDIVLDASTVSKRHAEIRYENGQFVLYDLASKNGTTVNNHRIQRQSLLDGDDIKFGDPAFVFKQVKIRPTR